MFCVSIPTVSDSQRENRPVAVLGNFVVAVRVHKDNTHKIPTPNCKCGKVCAG